MSWYFSTSGLAPETIIWRDALLAQAGTLAGDSVSIADNLVKAIKAQSFFSKIVYLYPMLGSNLVAAKMPLLDTLARGISTTFNLADANFSQSTGIQGNGTNRMITTLIKPSELGTSNNGGLGYWENNVSYAGDSTQPIGCYNTAQTNRFIIVGHGSARGGCWGAPAVAYATDGTAFGNGHHYLQRSSATLREYFFAGSSIATDTDSDATSGANNLDIRILGCDEGAGGTALRHWAGRCACAYLTNGTLSSGEVSDLHTTLQNYLITPTGR